MGERAIGNGRQQARPLHIAAAEIERIVLSGIGELIADRGRIAEALGSYIETAGLQQQLLARAHEVAAGVVGRKVL